VFSSGLLLTLLFFERLLNFAEAWQQGRLIKMLCRKKLQRSLAITL